MNIHRFYKNINNYFKYDNTLTEAMMRNNNRVKINYELFQQIGLLCPISHKKMIDPVISPQGYSFERENILIKLEQKPECPLTGAALTENQLVDNLNLRQALPFVSQIEQAVKYSSPIKLDHLENNLKVLCPITNQVMEHPVVAADGISYERQAIKQWLKDNNNRTPRGTEQTTPLIQNRVLENIVKLYQDIRINGIEFELFKGEKKVIQHKESPADNEPEDVGNIIIQRQQTHRNDEPLLEAEEPRPLQEEPQRAEPPRRPRDVEPPRLAREVQPPRRQLFNEAPQRSQHNVELPQPGKYNALRSRRKEEESDDVELPPRPRRNERGPLGAEIPVDDEAPPHVQPHHFEEPAILQPGQPQQQPVQPQMLFYPDERKILNDLRNFAQTFNSQQDEQIIKSEKGLFNNIKKFKNIRDKIKKIRDTLKDQGEENNPKFQQAANLTRQFNDLIRSLKQKVKEVKNRENRENRRRI